MKNKFYYLAIIILLNLGNLYSQCCPYLGDILIIPENPNTHDSIYLVTNVTTPNQGSYLGYEINNNGTDQINITACYWLGNLTALQDFTDTINLGRLDKGTYTIRFTALGTESDTECVPSDSTFADLAFEVSGTNSIENNFYKNEISCYPNPILNHNLIIHSTNKIRDIVIIDTHGRIIEKLENLYVLQYEYETKNLLKGAYFIKIIDDNDYVSIEKIRKLD